MIFKKRDEHTRGSDDGVVERVGEIHFAVRALYAHPETARLRVAEIGAGADLEIFLLARRPRLDIAGLDLEVGKIARAALKLTHGYLHGAEQLDGEAPHLLVPCHGILRLAYDDHFLFFKLVYAVYAALLYAVRTLFLTETGGVGGERLGKRVFGDDLIYELAYHGVLRRADKIEILTLDLVHHCVHIRLRHYALDDVAVDHEGRYAVDEALVYHEVARISENGAVQPCNVAHEIVEAVACDASGGVHVNAVEALHDLGVVGNGEVGHDGFAETLHLDVCAVVRADGNAGVYYVRYLEHELVDAGGVFLLKLFKLRKAVGVFLDLLLDLFRLFKLARILLCLTHEHTYLLGECVAACAKLARLGDRGAVERVKLYHLVHHRKLCFLKLFLYVFLDYIGVFTHKSYIQHFYFSCFFY